MNARIGVATRNRIAVSQLGSSQRSDELGQRDIDPPEGAGGDQSKDGGAILHHY